MTVDWGAIRTGIAAQAATGTGIAAAGADADSLEAIGSLPCVKVISIDTIRLDEARGGRNDAHAEAREAQVVGVLLVDSAAGDGRAITDAEPLVEQLFVVARTGIKLGLDYVVECWLEEAEIGEVDFNGETFWGAVLRWTVKVRETDLNRTA